MLETYIGFQEDDFKPRWTSKQQFERFVTAYRGYSQADSASPNEENLEWAHQLAELYMEVREGHDEVNQTNPMEEEYRTASEGESDREIESGTDEERPR